MSEKVINIRVHDRIAITESFEPYICGNGDYTVGFRFDAEWDKYPVKTARFTHDGVIHDVVFEGNECPFPPIFNVYDVYVGVYAGDLYVTTSARIRTKKSILCASGSPSDPEESVYNQIMELLNQKGDGGGEGGQCGCEQATNEEVLEVLLEMDAVPAVTVNGSPLTIDNNIVML